MLNESVEVKVKGLCIDSVLNSSTFLVSSVWDSVASRSSSLLNLPEYCFERFKVT